MQTGAPLVRLPRARQPSTSRACCYSPAPPAQRKLLTPKALGRREKTQALNRPPIRGRSRVPLTPPSPSHPWVCWKRGRPIRSTTGSTPTSAAGLWGPVTPRRTIINGAWPSQPWRETSPSPRLTTPPTPSTSVRHLRRKRRSRVAQAEIWVTKGPTGCPVGPCCAEVSPQG